MDLPNVCLIQLSMLSRKVFTTFVGICLRMVFGILRSRVCWNLALGYVKIIVGCKDLFESAVVGVFVLLLQLTFGLVGNGMEPVAFAFAAAT